MAFSTFHYLAALCLLFSAASGQSPWAWSCNSTTGMCSRVLAEEAQPAPLDLMQCKMTCSDRTLLWPLPTTKMEVDTSLEALGTFADPRLTFTLEILQATPTVEAHIRTFYEDIFMGYLDTMKGGYEGSSKEKSSADVSTIHLAVTVDAEFTDLFLDTDESYEIIVTEWEGDYEVGIVLNAVTYYGYRHAMETLSQLITWNSMSSLYQMHTEAWIVDAPSFPHRGVSLDTSRNFVPVDKIKRIIDGLSYSKMNVLHWHFSDSQSFPLCLPSAPQLCAYGSYSDGLVYSADDVVDLVNYAVIRGVRVVPELDTPAHAANGWQFGPAEGLGDLALCVNMLEDCRGGGCGILNPVNPNTYEVLGQVYLDLLSLFPAGDSFHMGADEVSSTGGFDCWRNSEEVMDWLHDHGMTGTDEDLFRLWEEFQTNASAVLQEAAVETAGQRRNLTVWTSTLTDRGSAALPTDEYTIHIWSVSDDEHIADVINQGYDVLMSPWDKWYLDTGFGNYADDLPYGEYRQWRTVYDFDPVAAYLDLPGADPDRVGQIKGGEACAWGETMGATSVESKIWPRAAAVGERLWTKPTGDWTSAEIRMVNHRERMAARGVAADAIQMLWCHQNEGRCRLFDY